MGVLLFDNRRRVRARAFKAIFAGGRPLQPQIVIWAAGDAGCMVLFFLFSLFGFFSCRDNIISHLSFVSL